MSWESQLLWCGVWEVLQASIRPENVLLGQTPCYLSSETVVACLP